MIYQEENPLASGYSIADITDPPWANFAQETKPKACCLQVVDCRLDVNHLSVVKVFWGALAAELSSPGSQVTLDPTLMFLLK